VRARRLYDDVGNAEPVGTDYAPTVASGTVCYARDNNSVVADNRAFAGKPVVGFVRQRR
jgi:hypothetical protein